MKNKIVIAHRGASFYSQGNTIEAYRKAIEFGADMLEFDLRRTRDRFFIAYHDEDISGRRVDSLTLSEIRGLSGDAEIPTLEEILELARKRIRLDVELKEENYEKDVVDMLLKHLRFGEFMVSSFNDSSLRIVKKTYPDVTVGLILGKDRPKNVVSTRLSELFPMKRCLDINADVLIPHWKLIRFGFLRRAKKYKKSVVVWTVNEKPMLSKFLKDEEIDGIITDIPDVALALRGEIQSGIAHGTREA
jgi:glycerophosphoryl diester phosphodiesterase